MRRSKPKSSGNELIIFGVGIMIISLILIGLYDDSEPASGRNALLVTAGIPIGLIVVILGAVSKVRERRR